MLAHPAGPETYLWRPAGTDETTVCWSVFPSSSRGFIVGNTIRQRVVSHVRVKCKLSIAALSCWQDMLCLLTAVCSLSTSSQSAIGNDLCLLPPTCPTCSAALFLLCLQYDIGNQRMGFMSVSDCSALADVWLSAGTVGGKSETARPGTTIS